MELFSPGHLLVIAIVAAVLFFGWKQLPEMSRSVGRSLRIFKTEIKGMSEDDKAREAAKEQAAIEGQPVARAEFVKNDAAKPVPPAQPVQPVAAQPAARPAAAARPAPRPTPSPNGRTPSRSTSGQ